METTVKNESAQERNACVGVPSTGKKEEELPSSIKFQLEMWRTISKCFEMPKTVEP
jgi:hypothetical protein